MQLKAEGTLAHPVASLQVLADRCSMKNKCHSWELTAGNPKGQCAIHWHTDAETGNEGLMPDPGEHIPEDDEA